MKRFLVIGLVVTTLGLLIAGFVTPLFAHGSDDGQANEAAWEAMHEACESGDWEAMAEAAEVVHGEGCGMTGDGMMDGDMMDSDMMDGDMMGGGMMGGGMMDSWN